MVDLIDAYKDTAITTQSKGKIVVLLYEGAIRFMNLAIQQIEQKDLVAKGRSITRAQDIIWELNSVLDMEQGGQIAKNLRSLYLYMNKRLIQANLQADPQIIKEVISLLETLNKGWKAIAD